MNVKLFIPIVFLMMACTSEHQEKIPSDVLEKEKFIEVLKDKSLIEAALNVNIKNVTDNTYDSVYNFNVFKENNISQAQYDSTVKYYSAKPEEFKLIMETVLEQLNVEKARH